MTSTALLFPQDTTPGRAGLDALLSVLEAQSLSCFQQESRLEDVEARAGSEAQGPVLAQWLGVILLAGPAVRVTLKTFFSASTVAGLLATRMRLAPEAVAPGLVDDFVREFSNLYAGGVKRVLGEGGISVGISLPLVTRGFDEVFNGVTAKRDETRAMRTLARGDGPALFSFAVSVVVVDEAALAAFVPPAPADATAAEDDMEFL